MLSRTVRIRRGSSLQSQGRRSCRRRRRGLSGAETMLLRLLDSSAESSCASRLLEAGTAVNAPSDAFGQSPAHLAACGGQAFFLLWQLQTGADLNQQDYFGEAPIHKAARTGSLECLALLVAGNARTDLCNKEGQTAEDLSWAFGFLECATFLMTVKQTQKMKLNEQLSCLLTDSCSFLRKAPAGQKRVCASKEPTRRKRMRSDDIS
uniref:Ankyrin repeat domain 37 n=1 Tax=Sphenodon punctatus TaxID=8508 RepID=A0A8D0HI24_SPHPU